MYETNQQQAEERNDFIIKRCAIIALDEYVAVEAAKIMLRTKSHDIAVNRQGIRSYSIRRIISLYYVYISGKEEMDIPIMLKEQ
jgi:formate-dependent phosphoribosylglycinamide formyltransferase (GAR transformylase)